MCFQSYCLTCCWHFVSYFKKQYRISNLTTTMILNWTVIWNSCDEFVFEACLLGRVNDIIGINIDYWTFNPVLISHREMFNMPLSLLINSLGEVVITHYVPFWTNFIVCGDFISKMRFGVAVVQMFYSHKCTMTVWHCVTLITRRQRNETKLRFSMWTLINFYLDIRCDNNRLQIIHKQIV